MLNNFIGETQTKERPHNAARVMSAIKFIIKIKITAHIYFQNNSRLVTINGFNVRKNNCIFCQLSLVAVNLGVVTR